MPVNNIFVLRPDNLGDIILFSGTLRHIRVIYPEANITLAVKQSYLNLLEICPYIDRVIGWEKLSSLPFDWLPEFRGKYRFNWFIRHLINKKFKTDAILLPVRSPTRDLLGMHDIVSSIPATRKIGIAGDYCNQSFEDDQAAEKIYSKRMKLRDNQQKIHELEINKNFLNFFSITSDTLDIWPEFWTDENDQQWAYRSIIHDKGLITIALCPGVVSLPGKYYPGFKYAQAIMALKDIEFSVIIFGSLAEMSMCEEATNALRKCENIKNIIDLSGQSTIRQMIEGMKRCDIVISPDTGALHIAVALKKPTVGIMGGGQYGRFYPWGDKKINRVANKHMDCYWCNWRCIYSTVRCVQEIQPTIISEQLRYALVEASLI